MRLWLKVFGGVVITAFYESRSTPWENFVLRNGEYLSDFEQKIFWLLAKNFRQGYQNSILRVQRNVLRKKFLWKNFIFLIIFRPWAIYFWTVVEYFLAGLSKLHSTCPEKHFEETKILKKKCQVFSEFGRKTFGSIMQAAVWVSWGTFWGKLFFLKKKFKFSFLLFLAKLFGGVVKTAFYVSRSTLRENFFETVLNCFRTLSKECSNLKSEKFQQNWLRIDKFQRKNFTYLGNDFHDGNWINIIDTAQKVPIPKTLSVNRKFRIIVRCSQQVRLSSEQTNSFLAGFLW